MTQRQSIGARLSIGAVAWAVLAVVGVGRAAAALPVPGAAQQRPVAIVGATVHPISGPQIDPGGVLFEQGKFTAIGVLPELPPGTETIDGAGKHVYPGLICAVGELGLVEINSVRATRDASETGQFNPNVRAQVAVNPDSELIPVTRANGVLLVLSSPSGGMISGTSALLQLDGWTWEQMTLRAPIAMHVQWPRLSHLDTSKPEDDPLQPLSDLFAAAERYRIGDHRGGVDLRLEALQPVLTGQLALIVEADSRRQIQSAVAFASQRGLRLIIRGGYDAESCADILREHDVPVIIPAIYRLPQRRSDDFDAAYSLPERLRAARVRFCIAGGDRFEASNLRNLPYHAATAVAYGLPVEEALRAITLSPAEILGVADRVGSLAVGKDATLIVTNGNPLEPSTHVWAAFIQGRRVDLANRHQALADKYLEKQRQASP